MWNLANVTVKFRALALSTAAFGVMPRHRASDAAARQTAV